MKVILAETAGFCYGVERAVNLARETAKARGGAMLGSIVHNAGVVREINERDYQDMHRDIAPLREAEDAVHFDTSKLNFEESERALLNLIQEKLK